MKPRPLPADPMIAQLVRQARATTMGRRALLAGAGGGAAALALAACSTGGATKPTAAPDESDSSKLVRWDNWALYIDVDDAGDYPTLDAFTTETGIKVEYTEAVDDNNTYYGKVKDQLALGQDIGADTVCLTDWMVGRWIRFGYTQELDQANIPNLKNLLPSLKDVGFDPGRKMSVPWQGGFAGICWNKEKLPNGIASVEDLWSSDLKGRVGVLSEMRDTMGLIMLDMGVDIAGDWGDDEFFAAIDVLEKQVGDGQVRNIKGNAYKEDLINEDTLAAIVWSGDIVQLNAENGDKWEFVVPDKGGTLWNDNFLVPIGSTHKKNVEKLIDYYYDPAVAAEVAAYVNYITPVAGAKEAAMAIDPELANNQLIFPDDTTLAKARVFRTLTGAEEQKYDAAFQGILLGS
ncbi:spermidine/putrescine ABC transporter substrate-binding protein [Cryobacterium sp. TMT1-62]|uniref:Spermidine/putrescine ABC transporter substrate-binding protein n=1 Tax=Cryobacterium sandaracinum TaxID=1259247 RepID=A0ABY2JMQ8_9MICO|nr:MULTISPECIES: spermidine/putrescine ABC transporter substrate-binding protein [Cryobacterium]TFB64652.1 spermidine/putrescine ABC transporter substrate-binding protein [Cryobacterium sp. Hz7]TFC34082.1 spermidine/putrescine ABC transporter substrate-binding protein [Cryobacterium sp. TMT2-14]TFC69593.1 spermidine/putrescine ABC transporter substrate-binding protein [Cryobacterium sp. TMT2-4]TFD06909.1 spermidine/putrescine ABC transporter substrate-binding protein [Cryobacterium sandaracinum